MKKQQILSIICLLVGILFIILGFFYGETNAGIFIIFPFIYGSGIYSIIGFLFIFIAIIVLFFSSFIDFQKKNKKIYHTELESIKKTSIKSGGFVLIGPIPIIFGTNWKITILLMIFAIIIIIISFFYYYSFLK